MLSELGRLYFSLGVDLNFFFISVLVGLNKVAYQQYDPCVALNYSVAEQPRFCID